MDGKATGQLRILVVDDHHDTTRFLTRLLAGDGHRATAAEGFHAALAAAEAERFDVMVCDIGLSDGDGCERLARVSAMYPIKSVAVTGYGTPSDLHRFESAGFDRWLMKPVSFTKLREAIEGVAAGRPPST